MGYHLFFRKKVKFCGFLLCLLLHSFTPPIGDISGSSTQAETMNLSEIQIRDPHILFYDGLYYLTGTTAFDGFLGYSSPDLEQWSPLGHLYQKNSSNYWAQYSFWAPEMVEYEGKFYLFFTANSDSYSRATGVAIADHPSGPFLDYMADPLTPAQYDCLDGHLFIDTDGELYFYYVYEWLQHGVHGTGEMWLQKIASNLTHLMGDPVSLWKGTDATWGSKVVDGPSMLKYEGIYYLFWSSFNSHNKGNYSVGYSTSNSPLGPFTIYSEPIINYDGGHSTWFHNNATGQRLITFHEPNELPNRAQIRELNWDENNQKWIIHPTEPVPNYNLIYWIVGGGGSSILFSVLLIFMRKRKRSTINL